MGATTLRATTAPVTRPTTAASTSSTIRLPTLPDWFTQSGGTDDLDLKLIETWIQYSLLKKTEPDASLIISGHPIDYWHTERERYEIMATYDNKNSGVLFKNKNKKQDNHPDFTGHIYLADGTKMSLAGWSKTSKNGEKYISLAMRDWKDDGNKKADGGDPDLFDA